MASVLVGDLHNFVPDKVVEVVVAWGVRRPELFGLCQVRERLAPTPASSLLHVRALSLAGRRHA